MMEQRKKTIQKDKKRQNLGHSVNEIKVALLIKLSSVSKEMYFPNLSRVSH